MEDEELTGLNGMLYFVLLSLSESEELSKTALCRGGAGFYDDVEFLGKMELAGLIETTPESLSNKTHYRLTFRGRSYVDRLVELGEEFNLKRPRR